ncbi:hypothetical protein FQN60_011730 [Etheostoma spectabile]|uniref:Voltage-dependent calcium channel gamma-3 subunit n=1 Tax=Etheostoma spectabile TaxID=54343 RepID=A0A5J5DMN1_9PERO|nr:hypothetical protein FQN60_011730 [Etheostoma spectabile]
MRLCNRGMLMLLTTAGAFCAFSLMTIAVGTDYWLYSRGMCRSKNLNDNETVRKNEEVLTHSGLWRTCCTEGTFRGVCKDIDHFAEDADYEQDAAEYLLRLSNIIGIIVYISANSGDPSQSDHKKSYSYGWSFYFGALSFVLAEMVGVLAVHVFIEKHRQLRTKGRPSVIKPPISRSSSYYRNRCYQNRSRRYSYRGTSAGDSISHSIRASLVRDREPSFSAESKAVECLPPPVTVGPEFMLYTLTSPFRDTKIDIPVEDLTTEAAHDNTEMLPGNCAANRRTTPV